MHDEMIDLTAADPILMARLGAYGDARLSPSLATTAHMRARVMAVAHRQAALIRADASLAVVDPDRIGAGEHTGPPAMARGARARRTRGRDARRRVTALLFAASLAVGAATGTSLAARPGGPLYDVRVGLEALALPQDPSDRASAELQRLRDRLTEALAASIVGDGQSMGAALAAYERILGEALGYSARTGDDVAEATLQDGVGRNIVVLQALAATVPDQAVPAIELAIQRALDRSSDAVRTISEARSNRGGAGSGGGSSGGGGSTTKPDPTTRPTKEPKPASTPKPTKAPAIPTIGKPTPNPDATPRPMPKGQSGS